MSHITFVKKILANRELCKKCKEVSERLHNDGLLDAIDHIAMADELDADSEGIRLAKRHKATRAPFFLVEDEVGTVTVFYNYLEFKKFMAEQDVDEN